MDSVPSAWVGTNWPYGLELIPLSRLAVHLFVKRFLFLYPREDCWPSLFSQVGLESTLCVEAMARIRVVS